MVKLFIGNLAESVDSTKIKQIFQPFTQVSDCDVVKNYAFIVSLKLEVDCSGMLSVFLMRMHKM